MEPILAGFVLAVCVVLLVRMLLNFRYQRRFDSLMRRAGGACRRFVQASYQWPSARRRAARAAAEAIRRARDGAANGNGQWQGDREGNVYKPKSFRRPRKPH